MSNMRPYILLLICFIAAYRAEIPEEDDILVLSDSNFDEALSANEFVLVKFYATWCGHCKALAPEYAKAAKQLKESGSKIRLAKVDATKETGLASRFQVEGYPTLKFFRNQSPIDYRGSRNAEGIVTWLEKKTGPALTPLETTDEADKYVKDHEISLIAFFTNKDDSKLKAIEEAAMKIDDHHFAVSHKEDIHTHLKAKDGQLVFFKTYDGGPATYTGDFDFDSIKAFISAHELPLVADFTPESSGKIFGSDIKIHLIIFTSPSGTGNEERIKTLNEVATEFMGKVRFVNVDVDVEDNGRLLEFFGVKKEDTPTYRLVNLQNELTKFQPESSSFKKEDLKNFVSKGLAGELKPLLLSAEIPEDWNSKPVKVLVGKNFNEVARDTSKDVFVEFYAPWCGHCKALVPIWDELAEAYESNADVVIAKMDSTANEVEGISVGSYPTLKFFPKGSDKIVDYDGERTLEAFKEFLQRETAGGKATHEEL